VTTRWPPMITSSKATTFRMDVFGCFESQRKKVTGKCKAGGGDFYCLLVKLSLPERLICLDSANTLIRGGGAPLFRGRRDCHRTHEGHRHSVRRQPPYSASDTHLISNWVNVRHRLSKPLTCPPSQPPLSLQETVILPRVDNAFSCLRHKWRVRE
jgi:hypothetical protein